MIRNVVIHLQGEQPLVGDVEAMPTSTDTAIVCTNLRHVDGKKPRMIDHTDSTFMFPLHHVRFLEVPRQGGPGMELQLSPGEFAEPEELPDLEPDEDFLRRIREA